MSSDKMSSILRMLVVVVCLVILPGILAAAPAEVRTEIPKEEQTTLGLYLTPKEAFEKWKADPEKVKILDVRTTEEYLFVGHVATAWNVPSMLQSYEWDPVAKRFPMKANPDFVSQVKQIAKPEEVLLVICRSGSRTARAVNRLAEAGFTRVYSIIDGMEGDAIDDPDSVFEGQRLKNGWKNSGLPWTYHVAPERVILPKAR